jgi:hypothetical protein
MKSNSITKPPVFEKLGNGAWYYNYNITENTKKDESGNETTSFDYDQVKVFGTPTAGVIKKLVIAETWDITQEIDLQNNAERFRLSLSEDESLQSNYIDYLNKVDTIKAMVEADFTNYKNL